MGFCIDTGKKCLGQSWYCEKREKATMGRNSLCSSWRKKK